MIKWRCDPVPLYPREKKRAGRSAALPTDGVKYALVNTGSQNLKGAEDHNAEAGKYDPKASRYAKGIVNPGESFASFEPGKWTDWTDAIAAFGNTGFNADMAYDNLPVKAYIYPLSEVEKAHNLSERIPTGGGEAAICPEDGYLLPDIARGQDPEQGKENRK